MLIPWAEPRKYKHPELYDSSNDKLLRKPSLCAERDFIHQLMRHIRSGPDIRTSLEMFV